MKETNFIKLSNGHRICYADYGDPKGRLVMYFHGWPSSRLQGFLLHEVALQRGVRLVAPDRPGVGQSDFVPARTLLDWPPVIAELAHELGYEQFAVMGVSGGGPYATAVASALPDRVLHAAVVCGAPPLAQFPDRSEMMWPYRALLRIRPYAPFLIPMILKASHWISQYPPDEPPMSWVMQWASAADREAMGETDFELVTRSFREGIAAGTKGVVLDGDVYTADWGIDFSRIKVPMSFWHGEDDQNIPFSMVRDYAAWIPSATMHSFPGEGHYSIISRSPQQVLDHLSAVWEKSVVD